MTFVPVFVLPRQTISLISLLYRSHSASLETAGRSSNQDIPRFIWNPKFRCHLKGSWRRRTVINLINTIFHVSRYSFKGWSFLRGFHTFSKSDLLWSHFEFPACYTSTGNVSELQRMAISTVLYSVCWIRQNVHSYRSRKRIISCPKDEQNGCAAHPASYSMNIWVI